MDFPVIENIEQVREAIKGRPEFIEAKREFRDGYGTMHEYTVFNYMVAHADSFDCPIRRECRGLIFDANGKVLSRRFHKFFNLGEKPETMNIDLSQPHVVLDKLDGSMITPLVFTSSALTVFERPIVRWATKMGITDIAGMVQNKFQNNRYMQFAIESHVDGWTPIFEYVGPYNRIVLPYKEEKLILLAMRKNLTGEYLTPSELRAMGDQFGIPVVSAYDKFSLDNLKDEIDIEGVVVRFDTGHMVKIKTDWYCAIHRAKENILFEKNVLRFILEDKLDDIIPHLPDEDRTRIETYRDEVLKNIDKASKDIEAIFERLGTMSRKDFALSYKKSAGNFVSSIIFSCWDRRGMVREEVIKLVLKNTGTQEKVDSVRPIIKAKWHPMGEVE